MTVWEAVILGIAQGIGEFLPISSSAHLVLVPWFVGWHYAGLTFDVALHLGTLLAVVSYFWRDWLDLIVAGLRRAPTQEGRLFWCVVVATIPGALFGYFLEE
ncbi:MAG: undecaprenyl-diphosphate phosphatase, partial [Moorella sp. (in: Bacteria)]|nr:undecaprenyl-diphosphate phosphatase [Moorella sp. (in: firmicutes)]